MPLKKLFQKRNSLKDMSAVKLANEEIDKLRSTVESDSGNEQLKKQPEMACSSNLVEDQDISDSRERVNEMSTEDDEMCNKYDTTRRKAYEDYCFLEETSHNQNRRKSAPVEISKVSDIRKKRSTSHKEQRLKSDKPDNSRRKCVSESSGGTSENEIPGKTVIQMKSEEFEAMVGRYVNRLIKESIVTAVKSVNVDNLCDEILQNISNKKHSANSEAEYEPKWSESISEYVELDDENSFVDTEVQEEVDSNADEERLEDIAVSKKSTTSPSDGYQTDFEESISLNSIDSEIKVTDTTAQNVILKSKSLETHNSIPTISSNSNAEVDQLQDSQIVEEISETQIENNNESDNTHFEQSNIEVCEVDSRISNNEISAKESEIMDENYRTLSNQIEIKLPDDTNSKNATSQNNEELHDTSDNALMSFQNDSQINYEDQIVDEVSTDEVLDLVENLPQKPKIYDDEKKMNWKMGYLHIKLPHKARGKGHLKAWKKRCVSIQPDEFVNDPKCPSLMISVYSSESGTARKHSAIFWKSISCQKAVVYRSSSRTHKYAFTISDDNKIVIHLAADCETASQEWMAAIRAILWPPSSVMQLEKMLNGKEYEISIIDNDFAYRAGLLGMYGYLTITRKKLILAHPQQGYVIQEWYLNTIDKFELMTQSKIEDAHKILAMTTCSDSSTGKGELLLYCTEAIAMLQSIASTIHQILTDHSVQEGGKYEKELAEMADWLVPTVSQSNADQNAEEYYKVPPRQVKSLLDIPNFIFDKKLSPVASVSCKPGEDMESAKSLTISKTNLTRASQDSGISAGNMSEDFLNCSSASFVVGGGTLPGKSSDSELSDSYTPPRTPDVELNKMFSNKEKNIPAPVT